MLRINRRTLAHYLQQQATHSTAYAPPVITHGIREARDNIRRIKSILRNWAINVEDHPDDVESNDESKQQSTLSKDQFLWLSTALRYSPNGEKIDGRKVLIELLGSIAEDFDPKNIDHHFCSGGSWITILGRYLINPNDHLVQKADLIALAVRDILRANINRQTITAQELASITGLPEVEVALMLELMSGHYGGGYFHRAGTGYGARGWASIRVDEDEVFDNYVKFQSIEMLAKRYLK